MTTYGISVPVAGSFNVWISADTEAEAITKAQQLGLSWKVELVDYDREDGAQDVELGDELHYGKIVQGNVFYGPTNDVEVFDVD